MTSYTAEFDDIPGTRVFTAERAKKGYELNQFCMSPTKEAESRAVQGGRARLPRPTTKMSEEQKQAALDRDYNRMIDLGGQIYFLAKIFATDGLSYLQAVSTMTGMPMDEYQQMMISGGRSPEGWRSIKDGN